MKRTLLILVMCLPMMVMAQKKKVAVYVAEEGGVDNAQKEIIEGVLIDAVLQSGQYEAVERAGDFLKQITKEQGYQHSGNVDNEQISALGKQFGVDYVCVAKISLYNNISYIQARMIDVETVTVLSIAQELYTSSDLKELMAAASKVANKLINLDGKYKSPIEDKQYGQVKNSTDYTSENSEYRMVRNNYSVRCSFGVKEYSYGTMQMDSKAYENYLFNNCPEAFLKFRKGRQTAISGWALFGFGCTLSAIGWSLAGIYDPSDMGISLGSIGVISVFTSLFVLPIGYHFQYSSADVFNNKCTNKRTAACTFNLQSSRDGIGIALTF